MTELTPILMDLIGNHDQYAADAVAWVRSELAGSTDDRLHALFRDAEVVEGLMKAAGMRAVLEYGRAYRETANDLDAQRASDASLRAAELMEPEWQAWQAVVHEYNGVVGRIVDSSMGAAGWITFNDPHANPLVNAIRLWGERLAALRRNQHDDLVADVLRQASEKYEPTPE